MIYQTILAATLCAIGGAETTRLSSSPRETLKELWDHFKATHGRTYRTMDDEATRYGVFLNTLSIIDARNAAESARNGGAVHGITRFADLTQEEFAERFLNSRVAHNMQNMNATKVQVVPLNGAVGSVDYTGKQTTAIKDQGNCGSCWAHAAAQQMESDGMRLNGNPASLELSVQQLVSCDKGEGQHGCMGGLQEPGFDYVRDNGGIVTAQDYPYTEKTGRCDTSINNYVVGVSGYSFIIDDNVAVTEEQFTSHVLSTGTLSIGVDATTWSTYKSGVMSDCGKGTDINHAVQIVGVDSSESGWWKIRNSWSADWGEDGNIRIAYGSNTCGLATEGGSYVNVFNI